MATYEATRYDFDGGSITGLTGVDTGTIIPWATASAPSGYLACDGSAVSRTTYSALFAVISTTYGVGDGSSTFNLPNLTDKIPVGKSNTKALASTGGADNANVTSVNVDNNTISQTNMPSHDHNSAGRGDRNTGNSGNQCPTINENAGNNTGGGSAHSHSINAATVSILQPFIEINYVIKT